MFVGSCWATTYAAKQSHWPKAGTDARCYWSLPQDFCWWPRSKSARGEHSRVLWKIWKGIYSSLSFCWC